MTIDHPVRRSSRTFAALLLASLTAATLLVAFAPSRPAVASDPTPQGPSIQYEDWQAHAADRPDLPPGGRVSVPFVPRASDQALVGGGSPRSLPAGRASAAQISATRQGVRWADVPGVPAPDAVAPTTPDGPILDPSDVVIGDGTSAVAEPGPKAASVAAAKGLRKEVFGFLPYWELTDATTVLDYDTLSTIAYFGVGADKGGNLQKQSGSTTTVGWSGWTSSKLSSVINTAHARGTRVVLTVQMFAWTTGQATNQAALLDSPTARLNLARQAAAAVRDRGADGINLDFEPIVSGRSDEFTAFVRTLRTELDKLARGYQLTFDATGWIGNYPIDTATAAGGADAIVIMGYDYRTAGSSSAGSIAPLGGPAYDIVDTLDAYLDRVPSSKLILGVPYYGRAWSTVSGALDAKTQSGTKYGESSSVLYDSAIDVATENGRLYDTTEQVAWSVYRRQNCSATYGCVMSWRQLYFDDARALGAKYDVVNQLGLRGVGIWALGYDGTRPDLRNVLNAKFVNDTTPPVAGIDALPLTMTDEGFIVRWSASDVSPIPTYDVQVSTDGGAWISWRTGTALTSDLFVGRTGHRYAFRVRGHDSHGNVSAWDVTTVGGPPAAIATGGFVRVVADSLNMRAAASTSSTKIGTLSTGDALAILDGPVTSGGYTWYKATGPLYEWSPVTRPETGFWVAAGSGSSEYLVPRQPLNVAVVAAPLSGLRLRSAPGAPGGGVGVAATFSPNGDGLADRVGIDWQVSSPLTNATLTVWRTGGTTVGTIPLGPQTVGSHHLDWDGKVAGTAVADGTYVVTLSGADSTRTYAAPAAGPIPAASAGAYSVTIDRIVLTRLAGADRYATAAAISKASFPSGAPVAYLSTGSNFPDALAGSVAAARAGGPLLLVTATGLPPATAAELARLKPTRIVVLGAPAVVGDGVAAAARKYATSGSLTRLAGADRYATAAAISKASFPSGAPVAYLSTGSNFPDALAGSVAAARAGGPLLLVTATGLPPATAAELARLKPTRIVVLGAPAVVGDGVAAAARKYATSGSLTRLAGADRYATAAAISKASFPSGAPVAYLSTGSNFPDALAGSVAAARAGGPLLLVTATGLPPATAAELARLKPTRIVVLGAPAVVGDGVAAAAKAAAR